MSAILSSWGWPQWTLIILYALSLVVNGYKHGEPRDPYNIGESLCAAFIVLTLLALGGFFG